MLPTREVSLMDIKVELLSVCRICKSKKLSKFLEFPKLPFFDDIVSKNKIGKEFVFSMKVYVCTDCYVVQSLHNVDIVNYYDNYQYIASDSLFTRKYMQILASKIWTEFNLEVGDRVIDIGAADGFQLQCFSQLGAMVLGYEPAHNLAKLALDRGVPVIEKLFDEHSIKTLPKEFEKVACVTLLHTFDHLQEPIKILIDIAKILDEDVGVLVIEVHDLEQMIENQETALFGHEHTIFLNFQTISAVLEKSGYKVINYNFIDRDLRRGTSMVLVAALNSSVYKKASFPSSYTKFKFDNLDTYFDFAKNVDNAFSLLRKYVETMRMMGLKLAGYGGWGRGVTFLSMAGFRQDDLIAVCDQNPMLHGNFTPETNIPIVHPDFLFDNAVDEVIVFNHAYLPEIESQQKHYIEIGGKITSVISILKGEYS